MEGYYVMFMVGAASALRFAAPLVRISGASSYAPLQTPTISHSSSIIATVSAAGLITTAMLLQIFATFGRFGGTFALLVPVPYILTLPLVLVVRTMARVTSSPVWNNWATCLPVTVHCFCVCWPLALRHGGYLDIAQTTLGFCANMSLMIACQLLMHVIDSSVPGTGPASVMRFMF